jgi:hypothetical protein
MLKSDKQSLDFIGQRLPALDRSQKEDRQRVTAQFYHRPSQNARIGNWKVEIRNWKLATLFSSFHFPISVFQRSGDIWRLPLYSFAL